MTGVVFARFPHIDDAGIAFHQFPHLCQGNLTVYAVKQVQSYQRGHVHCVFGSADHRGVAEFHILQVFQGAVHGDQGGDHIDAAVCFALADSLGAQQSSRRCFKDKFDMDGVGVRHEAHLVGRDHIGNFKRYSCCFCRFFVQAGAGSQQREDTDDRRTDKSFLLIPDPIDMICRGPGFHLGGPGQGQPHGFAGETVKHFDGVAYSINGRVAGLEVGVDFNAAGFTDGQSGVFRQCGFRTDANGHHHCVGLYLSSAGEFDDITANLFYSVLYY